MSEVDTPRAKLVELLWQLKGAFEQAEGGRSIHFNTLLRDSNYRRELINEAATSSNRQMRELGRSLRVLNSDGELTQSREKLASFNPDITETLSKVSAASAAPADKPPAKAARRALWLVGAVALLLVLGAALLLLAAGTRSETLRGSLTGVQRWTADKIWILDDIVYLEAGAQLTIEPGTVIQGRAGSALVVTRDATIMARGSVDAPIVFTSAQPVGQRQAGDWGGVVLLGNAPLNSRDAQIEGVPTVDSRGMFGGVDSRDNCGVLEYVRIEFAGYEVYANNELNGLTLGGCGSNTIVRHVQVHRASDDGIEVFGGTVDMKHILISGAADDSLDWDMGWTGRVQFLQVLQYPGMGDNAIEADNRDGRHDVQPVSQPTLYNVTLRSLASADKHQRGITLRRGSGGHFHNMIVSGFSGEAVDIKDRSTVSRLGSGMMSFGGLIFHDNGRASGRHFADELGRQDDDGGFDEAAYFARRSRLDADPGFRSSRDPVGQPEFRLRAQSAAAEAAEPVPEGEFWDQGAAYLGAVRPGSNRSWMAGWTSFALN